jgi:hypothetical protein
MGLPRDDEWFMGVARRTLVGTTSSDTLRILTGRVYTSPHQWVLEVPADGYRPKSENAIGKQDLEKEVESKMGVN